MIGKKTRETISRLKDAIERMEPSATNLQTMIGALCLTVEELAQQINDLREDQREDK